MKSFSSLLLVPFSAMVFNGCVDQSSLPAGQAQRVQQRTVLNDFPLFLTDGDLGGTTGKLIQIERDGTETILASGLDNPRGVATDRLGNVYVVEAGSPGRVTKFLAGNPGAPGEVVISGLADPSNIAVDSSGEIYVTEDVTKSVRRVSDKQVVLTMSEIPTALAIGVDDTVMVGSYYLDQMMWGLAPNAPTVTSNQPIGAAVDASGLVYVLEDLGGADSRVVRYDPKTAAAGVTVAQGVLTPTAIAVTANGDVYLVQAAGVAGIVVITADGAQHSLFKGAGPKTFMSPGFIAFSRK